MKTWEFFHGTAGRFAVLCFLLLLLPAVMLAGMRVGALNLPVSGIVDALLNQRGGVHYRILVDIRLPRILLGALAGGGLAAAGTILQGVMRNPLASPDIIGVSAGGGLAAVAIMMIFPAFGYLLAPCAFVGALATAFLVYLLAWKRGVAPVRLILAGVAVAAMLGALSGLILLLNAEQAGSVLGFAVGSLAGCSLVQLRQVGFYFLLGLPIAFLLGRRLNVLALGDDVAAGLGLKVERTRFVLLAVAALLAASAVCVAGMLGFVGLIAPHVVRMAIGYDHRYLLPASALFGAVMVVGCDAVARLMSGPVELPVGAVTALLGPPFFLYLLRKGSYEA